MSDKQQPKKQRHTARRVYNRLANEHGYSGCESMVRRYVRVAKEPVRECIFPHLCVIFKKICSQVSVDSDITYMAVLFF